MQDLDRDFCREGWLTTLDVRYKKEDGSDIIKPCFGYTMDTSREDLSSYLKRPADGDHEAVDKLLNEGKKKSDGRGLPPICVQRFTIKCKQDIASKGLSTATNKLVYMRYISRVRPELRKFEALLYLENSPLRHAIVSPTSRSFHVNRDSEHLNAHVKDVISDLNSDQKRNIVGMSKACLSVPSQAQICLMQGPPGTGKSSTIGGLTLQLLYSGMKDMKRQTMPRVLIVAPSNAAVDAVAKKLLTLREKIPEKIRFSMVRLGVETSMDEQVRKCSFGHHVERIVKKETSRVKNNNLENDIKKKQKIANHLYEQKMEAEEAGNTDLSSKLDRDYKDIQRQIKNTRSSMKEPQKVSEDIRRNAEENVLLDADVHLTTMSSSEMIGAQYSRVRDHRNISVCIMDESSQCVEPEALIPLKLGFRKLVMVGDQEQLQATVTSTSARRGEYQQSLFGRLTSCLSVGEDDDRGTAGSTPPMKFLRSPVLRLQTQYRMHPDIALWPNRYFYGSLLHNGETPVTTGRLVPYLLLHVESEEVSDRQQIFNREEELVIIDLVRAATDICGRTPKIGIITFYNRQKQNIALHLQKERLNSDDNIKVSTVDAFQVSSGQL